MKKHVSKKQNDPFAKLILDDYEKSIEASVNRGEWKSIKKKTEMKKMFEEAAARHDELMKSRKITLRINQGDLIRLKARAKNKNIPYQTLLNVLIRDFVEDNYRVNL